MPPINTAATTKPIATSVMRPISSGWSSPPSASPLTTERMMSPTTSSSTAAPSTTCPSGDSSWPRSASTRAEIPIDVAVSAAPDTIAGSDATPSQIAT